MGDDLVGVVGVEGGALEQDPALEVGEVLGAEECALAPRRSPELIWLILMILDESLGILSGRASRLTMRSMMTSTPSSLPSLTVLRNSSRFSGAIICL